MKKFALLCFFQLSLLITVRAQDVYFTKAGKIQFVAIQDTDVDATSRGALVTLDAKTGDLNFSILVKGFEFAKAAMQEKFNQKILETDKFPKAEFKGKIENVSKLNFSESRTYPVAVAGELTMHGVTKAVSAKGELSIAEGALSATSVFEVMIGDYGISNPGIGDGKIRISVDCKLEARK